MKNTLLSRRDLDFLLFEWLRVEELTKRQRYRTIRARPSTTCSTSPSKSRRSISPPTTNLPNRRAALRRNEVAVIPEVEGGTATRSRAPNWLA